MRVIFVDDEPRVLEGIARMLSMQGKDWQADYATSAELALTRLEAEPADIVVTDLRMPGGDGVQLLQTVQQRWPATLRVILSGQTEPDEVLRSFRVAHQFIAKPCDSRLLVQSLERISALQRLLQSSDLRALVGRIQHLPAAPRVYTQLTQSLGGESASAGDIASLVSQDPGLAAQVLHLVNSAFFSRGRSVTDIRGAVTRLGTNTLRMLVLTTEVFGSAPHAEELQRRALLASQIVGRMTTRRDECEIAQDGGTAGGRGAPDTRHRRAVRRSRDPRRRTHATDARGSGRVPPRHLGTVDADRRSGGVPGESRGVRCALLRRGHRARGGSARAR